MSLKDAFRSLRGGRDDGPHVEESAANSDVPEPMSFRPRYDGRYDGRVVRDDSPAPESNPPAGYLRFQAGKVFFAAADTPIESLAYTLSRSNNDPCFGDYTPAGRFTVQRRFERPVVHTVLDGAAEAGTRSFTARCTFPDSSTTVIHYTFVPDDAATPTD